jgi:hypothetical protein
VGGDYRIRNDRMQRNDPEKRVTPIDAVIEVIESDCPKEWARYCDLAHQLVPPKQPTEISKGESGRKLLTTNSKLDHRKEVPSD